MEKREAETVGLGFLRVESANLGDWEREVLGNDKRRGDLGREWVVGVVGEEREREGALRAVAMGGEG